MPNKKQDAPATTPEHPTTETASRHNNQRDYTPISQSKQQIFSWWLDRGFTFLPCYENSKYIRPGWGQYQKQITTIEDAKSIIGARCNFSIVCPPGHYVLDFDNVELYQRWEKDHASVARTYTEITPRSGRHVFLRGDVPHGIKLIKGVEIKSVCVVAPSVLPNGEYTRGNDEILFASSTEVFFSLSIPGTPTAYVLSLPRSPKKSFQSDASKIGKIKQHWNCLDVFKIYKPDLQFKIQRGYAVGLCPFHQDRHPSLFIVLDKDYFKCHACGVDGDVINLYARFEGITNAEAISRMSAVLELSR